jgi:HlyD family secretion protein
MKKKLIATAVVVLLIIVIVVLNTRGGGRGKTLDAEIVEADSITSWVRAEGTVRAENQVEIGTEVMGRITKITVREGDRVKKGDLLCKIDPSTYAARLSQTKAQLRISESRLEKAKLDVVRYSELLKDALVSQEEFERITTECDVLRAQMETAQFAVSEAQENLNKTALRSPVDGEVVGLNMEEGETVVMGIIGTPGSVIMTIADRRAMFVRAIVDETEIVKVKVGQKATVEVDAFPDTTFGGEVLRIGGMPVSNYGGTEQAVNFPVEVAVEGEETGLFPGMTATCNIIVARKDSAVVVPYGALGRRKVDEEETDVVFVIRNGEAKMVGVKIGVAGEKNAEIAEGVALGETLVVGPYKALRELKDGEAVKAKLEEKERADADKDEGDNKDLQDGQD